MRKWTGDVRAAHVGMRALAAGIAATAIFTVAAAAAQSSPEQKAEASADNPLPPEQQQPAAAGLEDILVTARRVAENQQDIPVSVTAFSGETLEKQNILAFKDVAAFTPGFVTRESPNNPSAFILALRGQVQTDSLATLDPSVGTYVDGVYWTRSYGLNADLLDVQSVQVLKGPQGTLFGRNTTGGALVIQTNDPTTDRLTGMVQGTYGRFNERIGTAVLNVPFGDVAAVRGAFQISKRDGFVKDRISGIEYNDRDNLTGRLKVLLHPTENVRLILSGEWFEFDQLSARANTLTLPGPRNNGPSVRYPGSVAEAAFNRANVDTTAVSTAPFVSGSPAPFQRIRAQTYGGTLSVDTGFGEIKFINAWRRVTGANALDLDGGISPIALTNLNQNLKQFSSELQLTGSLLDERLSFASGIVYLKEYGFDRSFSYANVATNPGVTRTRFDGTIDNSSMGIYAQASFKLTDRLTATGGLRYSIDDKGIVTRTGVILNASNALVSCITATRSVANDCRDQRQDTFSAISYTAGLDYKLGDDVLVYAKQSRGYRSGGQQLRSTSTFDTAPFQPEIVNEQEIGLKSEFLDRRLRLNLSAYHNTIKGAQRSVITQIGGVVQTVVENANIRNFGIEAELAARVADGLTFSANGSYNDPKYTRYIGVVGTTVGVDKAALGSRFDGLAKEQFSVSADYDRPTSFGRIALNVNYAWVGRYDTNPESIGTLLLVGNTAAQAQSVVDITQKPAAGFLGARATVGIGENFDIAVFGRNILNKRVFVHTLFVGDYASSIRNEPVTYGVTGTVRF